MKYIHPNPYKMHPSCCSHGGLDEGPWARRLGLRWVVPQKIVNDVTLALLSCDLEGPTGRNSQWLGMVSKSCQVHLVALTDQCAGAQCWLGGKLNRCTIVKMGPRTGPNERRAARRGAARGVLMKNVKGTKLLTVKPRSKLAFGQTQIKLMSDQVQVRAGT